MLEHHIESFTEFWTWSENNGVWRDLDPSLLVKDFSLESIVLKPPSKSISALPWSGKSAEYWDMFCFCVAFISQQGEQCLCQLVVITATEVISVLCFAEIDTDRDTRLAY